MLFHPVEDEPDPLAAILSLMLLKLLKHHHQAQDGQEGYIDFFGKVYSLERPGNTYPKKNPWVLHKARRTSDLGETGSIHDLSLQTRQTIKKCGTKAKIIARSQHSFYTHTKIGRTSPSPRWKSVTETGQLAILSKVNL